jgi:hypothetical protein
VENQDVHALHHFQQHLQDDTHGHRNSWCALKGSN